MAAQITESQSSRPARPTIREESSAVAGLVVLAVTPLAAALILLAVTTLILLARAALILLAKATLALLAGTTLILLAKAALILALLTETTLVLLAVALVLLTHPNRPPGYWSANVATLTRTRSAEPVSCGGKALTVAAFAGAKPSPAT